MHLQQQYNYNEWANRQWLDFVYNDARHEEYLYKLINHIVKAERAWLQRIMGDEWNRDLWQIEDKDALQQLMADNHNAFAAVLCCDTDARIKIVRLNGQEYEPAIADILFHTCYHGETHRGQLASFSAQNQLNYPMTDYMTWCIKHQL